MVKPADPLPDLDLVLTDSPFEESLECIKGVFLQMKIVTVNDLENSPRSLTCSFCGCSTHKLIEYILAWMESPPEPKSKSKRAAKPEPEPEPVATVLEEVVEEVPEEVVEEPEPVKESTTSKSKGRTSSSRKKE